MAVFIDVADRAVLAPLVDELGCEDVAGAQWFAVLEHILIDDGESIAGLDIEYEVDVVLEDLRELERDAVVEIGIRGRLEQRVLDGGAGRTGVDLERVLQH